MVYLYPLGCQSTVYCAIEPSAIRRTVGRAIEMAEKSAMSSAVLKLTGFYELGVFGEDEAEDFKKSNN